MKTSLKQTLVALLVATRGMLGMLNTIYLIICAMCFGAAMQASCGMTQATILSVPTLVFFIVGLIGWKIVCSKTRES